MCPKAKEIEVKLEGIMNSPSNLTGSTMGEDAQNEDKSDYNLAKEDFGW